MAECHIVVQTSDTQEVQAEVRTENLLVPVTVNLQRRRAYNTALKNQSAVEISTLTPTNRKLSLLLGGKNFEITGKGWIEFSADTICIVAMLHRLARQTSGQAINDYNILIGRADRIIMDDKILSGIINDLMIDPVPQSPLEKFIQTKRAIGRIAASVAVLKGLGDEDDSGSHSCRKEYDYIRYTDTGYQLS